MKYFSLILASAALVALLFLASAEPAVADGQSAPQFCSKVYPDADDNEVAGVFTSGKHPQLVVKIYSDMGSAWTKAIRAEKIADRLTNYCAFKPTFYQNLACAQIDGYDVVAPADELASVSSTPANNLPQFIITVDPGTVAGNGCKAPDQYASLLHETFGHILGAGIRDAKFDYQLSTDTEKKDRAVMYAGQAETAVANGDYDTACACYTRALQLYDDCNKWKLALAGILIYHSGAVTPDTTVQYSQPSYLLANLINPTPDDEATMNSLRAKI